MIATAFLLGLLGSFHCVGMCGPIAFLLPLNRENKWIKLGQIFIYHTSRILSYALLGLLFGVIGQRLNLFGFQQQISIAIGVLMVFLTLIPNRILSKYNFSQPIYRLIAKVKSALSSQLKKRTPVTFFTIGVLNGFLPCGLVYMAVFGAIATGGMMQGAFYMIAFGVGTIPLMTTAIYLGNFLNIKVRQRIRKAIPVFVVVIGLLFILRGLGLGIPYVSPKPVTHETEIHQMHHH